MEARQLCFRGNGIGNGEIKMYNLICIDFDGTIAQYDGWKGVGIFGEPIKGVKEALRNLEKAGKKIIVYTTRGEVNSISQYLKEHDIPYDYINPAPKNNSHMSRKPIADVYIDDRAIQFPGEWTAEFVQRVIDFEPWYKLDSFTESEEELQSKEVPELMEEAIEIYKNKNQDYGDSYKIIGHVMERIFPKGITLNNASEFNRIGALILILTKITRYANLFSKEKINFDSKSDTTLDMGVYSFILTYLENINQK